LLAASLLAASASALSAQRFPIRPPLQLAPSVQLAEVDNVARAHLEQVEGLLADGQWEEAVDALQAVLDAAGNTVIPAADDTGDDAGAFQRYLGFRPYCQQRIVDLASQAPEALTAYRHRVDPLAEQWYRQGCEQQDAERWRDVVEFFFASSYGDDALLRLGEWQLERGLFTSARTSWQQIGSTPLPGAAPPALVYPDSDLDPALVQARLVLVSILEGSPQRASREWAALQEFAPDAEGTLGGQRGRYVALLRDLLDRSRNWPPPAEPAGWTTYGGTSRREKIPAETIDVGLRPLWSIPLPRRVADDVLDADTSRAAEQRDSLLSYHPLIVDHQVIVNAGQQWEDIQAYDLHTGRALWPATDSGSPAARRGAVSDRAGGWGGESSAPGTAELGVPRFSLTAHDTALYVKLGSPVTSQPLPGRSELAPGGYLAALDRTAQKKRLLEIHLDGAAWGPGWAFEGPPVTDDANLYVVLRRRDNVRHQAHVACFDRKWGRLQWRQFVAAADTLGQGQYAEITYSLLSLHEGVLYCNTNLGAVAALRVSDGQLLWLVRYPRQPTSDDEPYRPLRHLYRDITPCLVHRDQVFAAPSDSDRIFALDAASGRVQWSTEPPNAVDVVHLLGVGQGHLLAGGSRLYWIDARTGRLAAHFPERVEEDTSGHGRGLLAGTWVYWPTVDRIHIFRQSGPQRPRQPIDLAPLGLRGGNLVVSDNVLLIAADSRLTALPARRDQVAQGDTEPEPTPLQPPD
jgi:outer membrane protein assembly factor BamB